MTRAEQMMRSTNSRALIGRDDTGIVTMVEDVRDFDGRVYRLEIQSTDDGSRAIAWCRSNPWGGVNGGESYHTGHIASDGLICIGSNSGARRPSESPYSLDFAMARARYWAALGFSALKVTGSFPQPQSE